uniref:Uncharacterized protein n=1 Tax=Fagus sylvatica TaxID=28930 RepID=A0A2N9E974_FAGSY
MTYHKKKIRSILVHKEILTGFLCSLSWIPAPLGLAGTYLDHQASPVVISDLIGSPGFADDHLGFISVYQASPVTISAPRAPPRLAVTLSAFLCTTGLTPVALDSRSTALGYSQACLGPRLGSLTPLPAPTSLGSSRIHSEHLTLESYLMSTKPTDATKLPKWLQEDAQIMTWLWNSLEPDVFNNVSYLESSKDIWDTLHLMYSFEENLTQIHELYQDMFSFQQGDRSVEEYFSLLQDLAPIRSQILSGKDIPTGERGDHSSRRGTHNGRSSRGGRSGSGGHGPRKSWANLTTIDGDNSTPISEEQVLISKTEYDSILQRASSSSMVPSGNTCLHSSSSPSWVIDLGASDHMTSNFSLLSNISNPSSPFSVTVANDTKTPVQGIGTVSTPDLTFPMSYTYLNAVLTATYLLNRMPSRVLKDVPLVPPPVESSPLLPPSASTLANPPLPQSTSDLDLLIALRKISSIVVPKAYKVALSHPGDLVHKPAGTSIVGCHWTYGLDYTETFSPVAKLNSIRIIISLAANLDWPLHQLDVKNAFLHGDLNETVYMAQPPGFESKGECVCHLKKSIYGLKQSPRAWFDKFNDIIITESDKEVSIVSQFMTSPRVPHMNVVIRILKYLKNAPGRGLFYQSSGHLRIEGYTDANWAGSPSDQKSTTGYCTFIGVYRAMAHTTCELTWLRTVLQEFGLLTQGPTPLYCDNQAAIHNASNPVFHERTKHIEVDCHFVRSKVESKDIIIPFVPSGSQLADIITKALSKNAIDSICNKLGVIDIYSPA